MKIIAYVCYIMKLKQRITRISKAFFMRLVMHRFILFVRCEISTPQFLGTQEDYYMFNQTGWYFILNRKFYTDWKVAGSHDVMGWKSFKDFRKSIVRCL